MIRNPFFTLTPWSTVNATEQRVFAGGAQLFNVSVFNQAFKLSALRWNELEVSQSRRVHLAFAHSDLSTVVHVHPEDFEEWNWLAAKGSSADMTNSWTVEVPFSKPGKWVAVVEYSLVEDEAPFRRRLQKRHGSLGKTLFEGRATFDVLPPLAGSPAPADPFLALKAPAPVPSVSGVSRVRGIILAPGPEEDRWVYPIDVNDLGLASPATPRTTALLNQTFLATMRTYPAVIMPNSCATAVIEFFSASGDRWIPADNLTPLLNATSHLMVVHENFTHASHTHGMPFPAVEGTPLAVQGYNITADGLPDACSGNDHGHAHHPPAPPRPFGSKLVAAVQFGAAGKYAVFVQSAAEPVGTLPADVGAVDKVMIAPRFVVEVGSGRESTTGQAIAPDAAARMSSPGSIPEAMAALPSAVAVDPGSAGSQSSSSINYTALWISLGVIGALLLAALGVVLYHRRRAAVGQEHPPVPHAKRNSIFAHKDPEGEYQELPDATAAARAMSKIPAAPGTEVIQMEPM
ncbi:hypothetical protein DFJ74DRAFT_661540 [Hyaloraphidium curvatum]|nr:hypothetical protein DFJ74DRAFT_661540 [Hyaloraphidium curvatum]